MRRAMSTRFPLLLKFLFPHEKLSVQVHPDDAAGPATSVSHGARPNAGTWLMPSRGADWAGTEARRNTANNLREAIHEKRAEELLNWINVYPGEMIYVAGGTVHTLGPGR